MCPRPRPSPSPQSQSQCPDRRTVLVGYPAHRPKTQDPDTTPGKLSLAAHGTLRPAQFHHLTAHLQGHHFALYLRFLLSMLILPGRRRMSSLPQCVLQAHNSHHLAAITTSGCLDDDFGNAPYHHLRFQSVHEHVSESVRSLDATL